MPSKHPGVSGSEDVQTCQIFNILGKVFTATLWAQHITGWGSSKDPTIWFTGEVIQWWHRQSIGVCSNLEWRKRKTYWSQSLRWRTFVASQWHKHHAPWDSRRGEQYLIVFCLTSLLIVSDGIPWQVGVHAHTKYPCIMYSWPDERVCVYLTCWWWAANFEIISVHAVVFPWSRTSRFRRFFDAVLQHTPSRFGPEKSQARRPRRGLWSPNLCLQVQDTDSCRTRSPRASLSPVSYTHLTLPTKRIV